MTKSIDESISYSLEATIGILPFLPQLLKDMWALGSSPEFVVQLLKPLNLIPGDTRALDLGCGKGAVSITLAKEFGFKNVGIDACSDFLKEAEQRAAENMVVHLCKFELGDIRQFVNNTQNFNFVSYISMGNILGKFDACVGKLRQMVRNGGYIIIDDGFLKGDKKISRVGYEHYTTHEQTLQQLTTHGDLLVTEIIYTDDQTRAINEEYIRALKSSSPDFIKKYPKTEQEILQYIRDQEEECRIIEENISGAIWLIQRKD
jgi:cyclopropane fatty-acyl-phospholipid synthase-like methyltransferase